MSNFLRIGFYIGAFLNLIAAILNLDELSFIIALLLLILGNQENKQRSD